MRWFPESDFEDQAIRFEKGLALAEELAAELEGEPKVSVE
jgi:hypothetical protein